MGSDPVLFMTNLFSHYYENKQYQIPKNDLRKKRLISDTIRFIDDLCAINDHVGFDRNFKNIHPSKLQFKMKTFQLSEASFLDLSIITENKQFKMQLYDNRDAFPYYIVRVLH